MTTAVQRLAGGTCIVGRLLACAAGGKGYMTCTVPFLALPLVPSQWEYLILDGLPSNCCARAEPSILQAGYC